jgi:putative oxidoreductase
MNALSLRNSFNPGTANNTGSLALLVLRLAVGSLMLTHGLGKLTMLFGEGPIQFLDPIGVGVTTSLMLTVFAEVFCSIFLIFGFATRLSSIPLLITMLVAILIVHAPDEFGRKELPLLYAVVYFVILLLGAGKYSVDQWLYQRMGRG